MQSAHYSPEGYVEVVWQGRGETADECFPIHMIARFSLARAKAIGKPKAKPKAA